MVCARPLTYISGEIRAFPRSQIEYKGFVEPAFGYFGKYRMVRKVR